jgi:hypothetical protein
VAHRALVAYERPEGRYDIHTSRWGGLDCQLARTITPTDPYAGGTVDPVPRVVARPFEDVLTMVDPVRHEALYRVSVEYAVETYLPLWLGLEHYLGASLTDEPQGLLVTVDSPDDVEAFREWFRAAKDTVAEAVLGGYLDAVSARDVLADAIKQHSDGREVVDPRAAIGETNGY